MTGRGTGEAVPETWQRHCVRAGGRDNDRKGGEEVNKIQSRERRRKHFSPQKESEMNVHLTPELLPLPR